ncbi:MAG: SUMF1/EgtB/PvdO family nonheme iron enzyme [Myxococcota bacterium]|nr:SUMF1/EgtB/PvdO family nonheme iron enzyme [Myxococcota bacterium]
MVRVGGFVVGWWVVVVGVMMMGGCKGSSQPSECFVSDDCALGSVCVSMAANPAWTSELGTGACVKEEECVDRFNCDGDRLLNARDIDPRNPESDSDGDGVSDSIDDCIVNGVVDGDFEECDDGNNSDGDACLSTCRVARCGDGVVQVGVEECDDGNDVSTDACLNSCKDAVCGDGVVWPEMEGCDDGDAISGGEGTCDSNCWGIQACGDSVTSGTEECDDGNDVETDACLTGCVRARCGDGHIRAGEEACDDNNRIDKDTCSNACVVRTPQCGDGVLDDGEVCDEGAANGASGGECSACQWIVGYVGMVKVPLGQEGAFTFGPEVGTVATAMEVAEFYMDIHEVSAGDYKACVDAGECTYGGSLTSEFRTFENGKDSSPINYVQWSDANDYCTWKGKRLPTQVEWEKTARGFTGRAEGRDYPWGDAVPGCDYTVMAEAGYGCGTDSTWEVGTKRADVSPFGAYDLGGNVKEWTSSSLSSDTTYRVVRGGSFADAVGFVGSSGLAVSHSETRRFDLGFRCAY